MLKDIARLSAFALALHFASGAVNAQVLNLYSSRHYQTDQALYDNFTKQTGIKINLHRGRRRSVDRAHTQRRRQEPRGCADHRRCRTPVARRADGTVPAGQIDRCWRSRIPSAFRHPDGLWFGFSTRARIIAYSKERVKPGEITTYEDLANPKWKGKICTRSSGHVYNLSLISSLVNYMGEAKAEEWTKAVASNLARAPKGGDTDQMMGVASGECDLAISNTYYYVRLLRSQKPEERQAVEKVGVVLPNQKDRGTHVNVSGGGVLKHAPNREAAIRFLEYLASDQAQNYFANGNNEWPVVASRQARQSGARVARQVQDRYAQPGGGRQEPADGAEDRGPVGVQVVHQCSSSPAPSAASRRARTHRSATARRAAPAPPRRW